MEIAEIASQAVQVLTPYMSTIATRGVDCVQDVGAHVVAELVAHRLMSANHADAWRGFTQKPESGGAIVSYLLAQQMTADSAFRDALAKAVRNAAANGHSPSIATTVVKNRSVEGTVLGRGARIHTGDIREGDRNNRGTVALAIISLLVIAGIVAALVKTQPWDSVQGSPTNSEGGVGASISAGKPPTGKTFGAADSAYMISPPGWQICAGDHTTVVNPGSSCAASPTTSSITTDHLMGTDSAPGCVTSEFGSTPTGVPAGVTTYLESLVPNSSVAAGYGVAPKGRAFLYVCFGPLPGASAYLGDQCFESLELATPSVAVMNSMEPLFWNTVKTATLGENPPSC